MPPPTTGGACGRYGRCTTSTRCNWSTSDQFVGLGAEIGLILLLFMLGLEHSAQELSQAIRRSGKIAALDTSLNVVPGFIGGIALG